MIKENQRILNSLLVVIDVLVILFSLVLAYYVRFKTTLFGPLGGSLPFFDYFLFTIFAIIPTYLLLYYFFHTFFYTTFSACISHSGISLQYCPVQRT